MTEQEGLFKAFHKDPDENSPLYDIADIDRIKDLSDEGLIERYNTIAAMDAEVWRRFDTPAFVLEGMFAEMSSLDPDGTEGVPGKELRDAGLTHGQCAAFYDAIIKPCMRDVCDRFLKDIHDYKNALVHEISKRDSLVHNGFESLWCNFGESEYDDGWRNAGEMIRRKKDE